jgi:hypothetical protein
MIKIGSELVYRDVIKMKKLINGYKFECLLG